MTSGSILKRVADYYSEKLRAHGATAQGVDWNSEASQRLRFTQLLQIVDHVAPFSINDYGCGYGALADYLQDTGREVTYRGYDIAADMTAEARRTHEGIPWCTFHARLEDLSPSDYTVASGIFNVKCETPEAEWLDYILETLERLRGLSTKGFAFNALTSYSDPECMRPDLYYADPCFVFDHCKRHFSRQVALLHDYELYEFTLLVRL